MDVEQLTLTLPEPDFYAVAVCAICGETLAAVPIEGGPSGRWDQAEAWCYLAQVDHDRQAHPERVRCG